MRVMFAGNYLRVRGEYPFTPWLANKPMELPPRARRIQLWIISRLGSEGTTSACAENTPSPDWWGDFCWNYLRVRGEYFSHLLLIRPVGELPPRARRILRLLSHDLKHRGTTSACAENTH